MSIERGIELLQDRKLSEAEREFTEILYEEPDNIDALCNIGIVFTEAEENEKAVKALTYCLQLKPNHVDALEAMGCAQLRKDRLDSAKHYLDQALSLSPENASVLRNLGVLCSKTGDSEQCYKYLQASFEINPRDFLTQYALASVHASFFKYSESREILERLVINSDTPEDIRCLAEEDLRRMERYT